MLGRQTQTVAFKRSFAAVLGASAFASASASAITPRGALHRFVRIPSRSLLAAAFPRLPHPPRLAPPRRRLSTLPMPDPHGEHDTRSKRKQPPTPSSERPMKQIKPEDGRARNGTYAAASPEPGVRDQTPTPSVDMDMDMDAGVDDFVPPSIAAAVHDTAEWQRTIETVVKSVVSIHFCQTCSFDTDAAVASEATGFVVDAERGYILTNRVRAGCVAR
jgi:hypothetical protein